MSARSPGTRPRTCYIRASKMVDPQKRLEHEMNRRRTFAIISHPDAGKTTLTEKLLL